MSEVEKDVCESEAKEIKEVTDKTYLAGLDLGQANDYSAFSIAEKNIHRERGKIWSKLSIGHLERYPIGTSYFDIAEEIAGRFEDPRLKIRGKLVVDQTGVGKPVMDILRKFGMRPIGITITGGYDVNEDGHGGFNVPKRDLVSALVSMYYGNLIAVMGSLKAAPEFNNELQHFSVKQNKSTGFESFEPDEANVHDDLVISVALIAWYSQYFDRVRIPGHGQPWIKDEEANKIDPLGYGMK